MGFLHTECDANKVIIKGENTMPKEFDRQLSLMHSVLDDMVEYCKNNNYFEYEIVD